MPKSKGRTLLCRRSGCGAAVGVAVATGRIWSSSSPRRPVDDPLAGFRKRSVSFGRYGDPYHCGGAWSGVAGCFLDELHARGQAEFGVDVG